MIAKVPARPEKAHFPKEDFHIDLEAATCTCPAGQKTQSLRVLNHRRNSPSGWKPAWGFVFDGRVCRGCNLRSQCIASKNGKGRTVSQCIAACTPRKLYSSRLGPYSIAKPSLSTESGARWWNTGWRDWSNLECARRGTLAAQRPCSNSLWRPRWLT